MKTGILESLSFKKTFEGKGGKFVRHYYKVKVAGEAEGETFFPTKDPAWLRVGETISYETETDNRGGFNYKIQPPTGTVTETPKKSSGGGSWGSKDAETQHLIIRQSCISSACSIVSTMPATERTPEKVVDVAKMFESFIWDNINQKTVKFND